ncbi:tol-pal system YbgF family protein [Novipirellula sp.]|uniref:tetratricopeptide repeat protein n=1 Tax=Novipirellula sp. TaxID=2795430 RepID=UPI003565E3F2
MSSDDWYRRTTWTETDRSEFQARLKRSRGDYHKAQYLRIQAHHLAAAKQTLAAIELLDQLFADFPHESQLASARLQYAECMLALDRLDDAIASYRLAFAAEQAYPNSRSQLWLDYPWLLVTRGISQHYDEIDTYLEWGERKTTFPVEEFRLQTILSFRADDSGDSNAATAHAQVALAAAAKQHSGFVPHPTVGLVGNPEPTVLDRLQRLAGV